MKLFICTDMEGVSGVISSPDWTYPGKLFYERGQRLLTLETNAAVRGFFEGGFDEIVVVDGHGPGGIILEELDPRVKYLRPLGIKWPLGLDGSFDALAWVGQHAKAGTTFAHLAHTGWFGVLDYALNGISVGEFGQLMYSGAELGVAPVFGSGDEAFCAEARALAPRIRTVTVKRGLNDEPGHGKDCEAYRAHNTAAEHLHPQLARELIYKGALAAARAFTADPAAFRVEPLARPVSRKVVLRGDANGPGKVTEDAHPGGVIALMKVNADH